MNTVKTQMVFTGYVTEKSGQGLRQNRKLEVGTEAEDIEESYLFDCFSMASSSRFLINPICPEVALPTMNGPSTSITNQEKNHRLAYSLWRHFLKCSFFFSDNYSLSQVEKK